MVNEFEISVVVNTPVNISEDRFNEMFLDWVESNGFRCGGIIKDITHEDTN